MSRSQEHKIEHDRETEQGEGGRHDPHPPQDPSAGAIVLEGKSHALDHTALNRLRRMKLSRSISSRRCRMNASVDLSSGITRYSRAFTRRFTFSISSMS